MSGSSGLRERLGRPAETPAGRPAPSGIPVRIELSTPADFGKPVSLADALKEVGLTLAEAHRVLNALKAGDTVRIDARLPPDRDVLGAMLALGVQVRSEAVPNGRARVPEPGE